MNVHTKITTHIALHQLTAVSHIKGDLAYYLLLRSIQLQLQE